MCFRTDHLWDMRIPPYESDSKQWRYSKAQQPGKTPDLNLHVWSHCGVTCNQAQLLWKCDPKSRQPPGVQGLPSVLVWSSRWKEERIIWALLAHRWPKALLYHSGDLPLQYKQQTMHRFHLQWGPEPPVGEHLYLPTPEVHSGDVCEPGPGSPTGLQEVLRLQHHPSHRPSVWAVIMLDRHAHERAGAFTQVCAPRSAAGEGQKPHTQIRFGRLFFKSAIQNELQCKYS